MNRLNNALTERLQIRHPLIQAPMAGGIATPQLVAAVAEAGGLGSLAAGYLEPEQIRAAIRAVRALTGRPFAVNLFVPQPSREDPARTARAAELLAPVRAELGLPAARPPSPPPEFGDQLEVLLEEKVAVVSFTFGVPQPEEMAALKEWNMLTLGTATHLLEALVLEESGVDMIVAQGAEAGGHRGTFLGPPERGLVSTLALLPLLADHVHVPLIAAGGIMDGRGIAAALTLGAAGVQMGTAFLTCPESGAHPQYKQRLAECAEFDTVLTRAFSGRLARGLDNRFIRELQAYEGELPEFPIQHALTQDIRQAAARQNRPEFMALWAGQGCALCTPKPAGELVAQWMEQVREIMNRRGGQKEAAL